MGDDREQLTIFDPKAGPVVIPHKPKAKPTYRYCPRNGTKCDDCLLAHVTVPDAPLARTVRWARTEAGTTRYLCSAHANWWRDEDRLPLLHEGEQKP